MAQETPDIRVIVGVDGASIDGKSGALILKELQKIATQIGSENAPQVAFTVDVAKTTKNVQNQLNEIVKGIQITPIDLNIRTNQSSIGSLNGNTKPNMSALSEEKQTLSDLIIQKSKDVEETKKQEKANRDSAKAAKELSSAFEKAHSGIVGDGSISKEIAAIDLAVLRLGSNANEIVDPLTKAKEAYANLVSYNTELSGKEKNGIIITDAEKKNLIEYSKLYQEVIDRTKQISSVKLSQNQMEFASEKNLSNLEKLSKRMSEIIRLNDRLFGDSKLSATATNLQAEISSAISNGETNEAVTKRLTQEVDAFNNSLIRADKTGQTFGTKLSAQMQKLGVYFSAATIMMGAWRQTKNIITNVTELDTKVTDLQIATGNSRQETEKLIRTYSEMGKQLGSTTVDVANAADAWLRQGYSVAESNALIKNSMMLSKLGQIDSAEATKALTSAMKGYKLSVEDSIGVVDKFTSLDMDAAVSAGFIATAMSETATGARLAGIEMDRLAGYITTVGEVTQDGAESVGTFYRTLFARMGNIKVGRFVDDETGESLSDVESVLSKLGIALRDGEKNFRNFGVVLDETWDKWGTFSQVDQNAIAVAFSGTRQQEKFKTLMDNYGQAMEYAETAATSAGTALNKYENSYLVSTQAAQDRFTAQFELLSKTVLESGLINDTYDTGTGFLGILTGIVDNLGIIPTLATVAAGALSSIGNRGKPVKQNSGGVRNYLMALKIYAHLLRKVAQATNRGYVLKYKEIKLGCVNDIYTVK